MKLLYITPLYPSEADPMQGIMIQELAYALRDVGVDLRLVALDGSLAWPFCRLNRYRYEPAKGCVKKHPWILKYDVRTWPRNFAITLRAQIWGRIIARRVQETWPDFRPDIVHGRTFIPGSIIANCIARSFKCPMVVSTHGADTRELIERIESRIAILRMCRDMPAVICVGESVKKRLQQYGAKADNLHVIYNGMNLSKIHQGPNPLANRYKNNFLVVGVGNLKNTKGFDLLIEAISKLKPLCPDLKGVIVGGGSEHNKLQELINQLSMQETIELVGAKSSPETMAYMDACDVFCLPSWSEGFGIVYLEAMAHGKAVIGVEDQGIANIIRENKTGILVPPHNASAVAKALKTLIDEPQTRTQMANRGKSLVYDKFSWQHCATKLVELYKNVLCTKELPQKKVLT